MAIQKDYLDSKPAGLLIIGIIYFVAALIGVFIGFTLPYNIYINILIADIVATVIVYIFAVAYKNSSIYDPYWSVAPLFIGVVLCIVFAPIKWNSSLLLIALIIWGVRLTVNWAYTFKNLKIQDWRYSQFEERYPKIYQLINFTGIFLMPTLVVYCCFIPAIVAFKHNVDINILSVIGFMVCLIGIAFETVSDIQMHLFRKKGKTSVINQGLWYYSRHPNYFGEILFWWGVYLFALAVGFDYWWTFFGALINNLMFLFISIPLAEKRYIKREGYAEYKNRTSMLIPFRKLN